MSGDLLIRGSEKVIDHYRLLLASAKTERERQLYLGRIEREERLLGHSRVGCRTGWRRDFSGRRGSICGVRRRAEAARAEPMEVGRFHRRGRGRHVRLGVQSRRREVQGRARSLSSALRKRVAGGGRRRVTGNRLGTLVVVSRLSGSRPAETDSDA